MKNVLNSLMILEEVARRQPVGVGELSRALEMPKSSVQRALVTLQSAGWIANTGVEVTRWVMTTKALQLSSYSPEPELKDVAAPELARLREETGETIHLILVTGNDFDLNLIIIESLESSKPVRVTLPLGTSLPVNASANGKAVLAKCSEERLERLLDNMVGFTSATITDRTQFRSELVRTRNRRFATNKGEWRQGISAVASAVLDGKGIPVASVSVSFPTQRIEKDTYKSYGQLAADAAERIQKGLFFK